MFEFKREKGTYNQARKDFMGMRYEASTSRPFVYDMSPLYDYSVLEEPLEKGSTLEIFLKSSLELIKD